MNNKQDILNELKTLSPLLFNLKEKEESITVPAHFFEELVDIVLLQTKVESGILSALKIENPHVPGGYFENLGDAVLFKINSAEKDNIIVLPKSSNKILKLFSRVAIAACVVGVMFFAKQIMQPNLPTNNCENGIACLTQEEVYNYMNANSHDFDVQQIQETVIPVLEKAEPKIEIDKKEATEYIESNKIILDAEDASTDIF